MNIQQKRFLQKPLQISLQKSQQGAASILMAVVILFAITLISVFTARTTITEQKISGNEFRGKQAFEAAEAGLQKGIAYYNNGGIDHDADNDTDTIGIGAVYIDTDPDDGTDWSGVAYLTPADVGYQGPQTGTTSYHVAFCEPTKIPLPAGATLPPVCNTDLTISIEGCDEPTDPGLVMVYSCGWSDDRTAVKTIRQIVRHQSVLSGTAQAPYIVRGFVGSGGNFTVKNQYSNTTIWTGAVPGSFGSFDTYIDVDGDGTLDGFPASPSSDTTSLGADVISDDANLAGSTVPEFFLNFFGKSKIATLAEASANQYGIVIPDGGNMPDLGDSYNKLIYVTGDITSNSTLGDQDNPVILIVDGTLSLNGAPDIWGVVYAVNLDGTGGTEVHGTMIVENTATNVGTVTITYDPTAIGNLLGPGGPGGRGSVSGSWQDY